MSALVGAMQYGAGIFGAALVAAFADGTPRPMAWVIACGGVGSAVCAWRLVSRRVQIPAADQQTVSQNAISR